MMPLSDVFLLMFCVIDNVIEFRPKSALDIDTREAIFLLRYLNSLSCIVMCIYLISHSFQHFNTCEYGFFGRVIFRHVWEDSNTVKSEEIISVFFLLMYNASQTFWHLSPSLFFIFNNYWFLHFIVKYVEWELCTVKKCKQIKYFF